MTSKRFLLEVWSCLYLAVAPAVAMSLSLTGCGAEATVPPACAGATACPSPSNAIPWAVQLSPSDPTVSGDPTHQLMAQEQNPLSFNGNGMAQLQYRPTALVAGNMLDAQGIALSGARVIASLDALIPGQSAYSTGTLTSPTGAWGLSVPLAQQPSSQPYHFWVGFDNPSRASLSPPLWRNDVVVGDSMLPLRLRSPADLAIVTGRIIDNLGDGVANMTVQVLDANNQVVSSTAVSDPTPGPTSGSYQVLVDPTLSMVSGSAFTVVVRPAAGDTQTPTLESTLQPPSAGSQTVVDFAVPSQRTPAIFELPIRGGDSAANSVPVAGASVTAQVVLQDPATMKLGNRAYYVTTGQSDDSGTVRLMLVPANLGGSNLVYQMSVSSPSQSPFGSQSQIEVQVGPNAGLLGPVLLPLRPQVSGTLLDAQGVPVAGAEVAASLITTSTMGSSPLGSMAVTADVPQATTGLDGSFSLNLDPGDYDLEFLPIPGTQARSSLDNQRIGMSNVNLGQIRLPVITLGTVQVISPSGAPVQNTKVRIFQMPNTSPQPGLACDGSLPCSGVAKLRVEAFTDQDGRVQVLLPGGSPLLQ